MSEIIVNKMQLQILNSIVNEISSILNDPYAPISIIYLHMYAPHMYKFTMYALNMFMKQYIVQNALLYVPLLVDVRINRPLQKVPLMDVQRMWVRPLL